MKLIWKMEKFMILMFPKWKWRRSTILNVIKTECVQTQIYRRLKEKFIVDFFSKVDVIGDPAANMVIWSMKLRKVKQESQFSLGYNNVFFSR